MCFEIPVCLFFNYLITPGEKKKKKEISLWYTTISKNPTIALYLFLLQEIFFHLLAAYPVQSLLGFKGVMNPVAANSSNVILKLVSS